MPWIFNPFSGKFDYYQASTGGAGTPATTVVSETTAGQSPAVGVSTNYAREDHTHGTPAASGSGGPVSFTQNVPTSDIVVPSGSSAYVPMYYEIGLGRTLELSLNSFFEIG